MAKEKPVTVYRCPICNGEIYFEVPSDFERHLIREPDHLERLLREYADKCKVKVSKTAGKWCLS